MHLLEKDGFPSLRAKKGVKNAPPPSPQQNPPALHIYNGCNHKIHLLVTNTLSRGPYYIMCQVLLHRVSPSDICYLIFVRGHP